MQILKMNVLAETGAVQEVDAMPETDGWAVWITYACHGCERREVLERQRGGTRVFATLEAVARCVAAAGLAGFRVQVRPP